MRPASAWAILALAGALACAQAITPAPPLPTPSAPAGDTSEALDSLLSRADSLYAAREVAEVREAAGLWLQAAKADPSSLDALTGLARACVWLADHEPHEEGRREAAGRAVEAAQWCEQAAPRDPRCEYWMGAGLGVQARERRATALDALPKIMQSFQRAQAGDPDQDHAGPDRALALFFVRAPGWPAGPGDPDTGLEHARAAVARDPEFAPNQMALAEAQAATNDRAASGETYRKALDLARRAAAEGDPDAAEWIREIEEKLAAAR